MSGNARKHEVIDRKLYDKIVAIADGYGSQAAAQRFGITKPQVNKIRRDHARAKENTAAERR